MEVELVSYMPDPVENIAKAMRSCRTKEPMHEVELEKEPEKYVIDAIDRGHHSVLEHAVFTFSINKVSRVVTHELVRHRLASYSQMSTRHKKAKEIEGNEMIVPDGLSTEMKENFKEGYNKSVERFLSATGDGAPIGHARYILPQATSTHITVTANLREWRHILELRMDKAAQREIRKLATRIYDDLWEIDPVLVYDIRRKEV